MLEINKDKDNPCQDTTRPLAFKWVVKKPIEVMACQMKEPFKVHTLEGIMEGGEGDYLIRGVKGEYYPCAKDIFELTYEDKYALNAKGEK